MNIPPVTLMLDVSPRVEALIGRVLAALSPPQPDAALAREIHRLNETLSALGWNARAAAEQIASPAASGEASAPQKPDVVAEPAVSPSPPVPPLGEADEPDTSPAAAPAAPEPDVPAPRAIGSPVWTDARRFWGRQMWRAGLRGRDVWELLNRLPGWPIASPQSVAAEAKAHGWVRDVPVPRGSGAEHVGQTNRDAWTELHGPAFNAACDGLAVPAPEPEAEPTAEPPAGAVVEMELAEASSVENEPDTSPAAAQLCARPDGEAEPPCSPVAQDTAPPATPPPAGKPPLPADLPVVSALSSGDWLTPERWEILRVGWVSGVSTALLMAQMAQLPGPRLPSGSMIATRVNNRGLRRPEGYQPDKRAPAFVQAPAAAPPPAPPPAAPPQLVTRDGYFSLAQREAADLEAHEHAVPITLADALTWGVRNDVAVKPNERPLDAFKRVNSRRVALGLPPYRRIAQRTIFREALPDVNAIARGNAA
jgi:hypothetical protein